MMLSTGDLIQGTVHLVGEQNSMLWVAKKWKELCDIRRAEKHIPLPFLVQYGQIEVSIASLSSKRCNM